MMGVGWVGGGGVERVCGRHDTTSCRVKVRIRFRERCFFVPLLAMIWRLIVCLCVGGSLYLFVVVV